MLFTSLIEQWNVPMNIVYKLDLLYIEYDKLIIANYKFTLDIILQLGLCNQYVDIERCIQWSVCKP